MGGGGGATYLEGGHSSPTQVSVVGASRGTEGTNLGELFGEAFLPHVHGCYGGGRVRLRLSSALEVG